MLVDTDVLIDVALDRRPHSESAARLLDRLERGPRSAFIAWHSASNFYLLVAPSRGGADARAFIADLLQFVAIAPTDTDSLRYAASLPMKDFEDAMQVAAARACGGYAYRNAQRKRLRAITCYGDHHPGGGPGRALLSGPSPLPRVTLRRVHE